MAAVPVKTMLERVLTTATLSAKEREAFEGMWDWAHRSGLSNKQKAWVEEVYYKQQLDRPKPAPQRAKKTGFINADVQTIKRARSLDHFLELCPEASEAVKTRVEKFFKSGGEVIEIRPKETK